MNAMTFEFVVVEILTMVVPILPVHEREKRAEKELKKNARDAARNVNDNIV